MCEDISSTVDLIMDTLLVDLVNARKAEIFEDIVFEGKRRYYIEDLTKRDYTLENTTPYQLKILNFAIEEHAWGLLLCKTVTFLLEEFPEYKEKILDFRCPWSKAAMFTKEKGINYKKLDDDLFINCNHTALHACWFLQDILDFFNIDKSTVYFLIHRPSSAEPKHVKDYVERRFKKDFSHYIVIYYDKSDEYAQKVVSNIEKYLNPILQKLSKSYSNFFLFDDVPTLYNYVKKAREYIQFKVDASAKVKNALNKYLDYLIEYYKS